jgi:hypothetical protein
MLGLLTYVPLSQENSIDGKKFTPTLGLPNVTKTNLPKKSMSVCCVYTTAVAATKTNPLKKSVFVLCLHYRWHRNKPTQRKDDSARWRDGSRVAVNRQMRDGWTVRPAGWTIRWMDEFTHLTSRHLLIYIILLHVKWRNFIESWYELLEPNISWTWFEINCSSMTHNNNENIHGRKRKNSYYHWIWQ